MQEIPAVTEAAPAAIEVAEEVPPFAIDPSPTAVDADTDTDTDPIEGSTEYEDEEEDDGDEEDQDFDEDSDLPDSERQLRAVLRAQGYTFDDNGAPIAPEGTEPPAADPTGTGAGGENPARTEPAAAPAEFQNPAEFQGFPVRADGLDLFDIAYEDPTSDEAQELIHGTDDEDGIGEAGYIALVHRYNRAKDAYTQDYEYRVGQDVQGRIPAFQADVQAARAEVRGYLADLGDTHADTLLNDYLPKANAVIAAYKSERVAQLTAERVSPRRAELIAERELLSTEGLYNRAIAQAVLEDFPAFLKSVVAAARAETPAALPVKTAPRPPVPAVSRAGASAAAPPARAAERIVPSKEVIELCKQTGEDPVEFERYLRTMN